MGSLSDVQLRSEIFLNIFHKQAPPCFGTIPWISLNIICQSYSIFCPLFVLSARDISCPPFATLISFLSMPSVPKSPPGIHSIPAAYSCSMPPISWQKPQFLSPSRLSLSVIIFKWIELWLLIPKDLPVDTSVTCLPSFLRVDEALPLPCRASRYCLRKLFNIVDPV